MSIRKKTLLVVGMTIFILLVSLAVTSRIMVLGGFTELEKQETRLDVERVLNNFSDIFAGLDATAKDWASWDASYAFVEDGNQRYIDENLTGSVLINLRLNFMLFFDEFGKLVAGKNIDLVQPAEMRLPPDFLKLPADRDLLLQHQDTAGSKTGFVMTSLGPAMVASRPITKSDYSGPIRGALVIGRYLDSLEIKRIASMMNLSFSVHAFNDDAKLSGFRALLPVLYKENEIAVKPVNSKSISGFMLQNDFYGNAAFIVEVTAPRIIYNRGRDTLVYFIIALFIIGLISIVFMMLMLEITVVSPLSRLSRNVGKIESVEDLKQRIPVKSKDELGHLAQVINAMLDQLSKGAAALKETNERLSQEVEERKGIENALKQSHYELERRVQERTSELTIANAKLKQEIEDRIQAELSVRESERKYRDLFDHANDLIQLNDDKWHFLKVNKKWVETLKYREGQITDLLIWDIIHPDHLENSKEKFQRILLGESVENFETIFVSSDGTCVPVEGNVNCQFEDGRPALIRSIFRDISERKLAEEEKQKLESQLHRSQKLKALGILAGGIAHDFNNLLTSIQGNASLMLYDIDDAHPFYNHIKNIEISVKSGARLTAQLLGYARKGRYENRLLNLNQLVRETITTFGRTKKEITIDMLLADDLHHIEADRGQLEQVLLNLCINAADAMPGGGKLILRTLNITHEDMVCKSYEPLPGNYVKLAVTDTGVGMDPKIQEYIFDPFFTTKEMGRGTGLGLASVYGIVKSHGGYIDVESAPGCGSTFSVYLPASSKKAETPGEVFEDISVGDETILLVDDEALVLDIGADMLRRLGYAVLEARGGREAIDIFKEKKDKIDLVILDMIMPEISGEKAFDAIREIKADAKVLLSSGYSIDGTATKIMNRGCNGFLQKPFSLESLSEKIREILSADKQSREES